MKMQHNGCAATFLRCMASGIKLPAIIELALP